MHAELHVATTAVLSVAAATVVSIKNSVSVSALAVFVTLSVNVIVHMYLGNAVFVTLSVPVKASVTVFVPAVIALVEVSPQPLVPPTTIVPVSRTLITTSGVESFVAMV